VFRSPDRNTPTTEGLRAVFRSPDRNTPTTEGLRAVFQSPDRNTPTTEGLRAVFRSPDRNTPTTEGLQNLAANYTRVRETCGRTGGAVAQGAPQTCAQQGDIGASLLARVSCHSPSVPALASRGT